MKFEETVQYLYDHYPVLYQKRWQALNQLFCVIGNGFEWENGELIEVYSPKLTPSYVPKLVDGKAYVSDETIKADLRKFLADSPHDSHRKELLIEKIIEESEEIEFYPLSEYSKIFRYPDNIKPDWLIGLKETISLLLEHNPGGHYEKMNSWQKEEHREAYEENHMYTEKLYELSKILHVQ